MGESQEKILLSIIIPVYNVELYLKDCLASVFGQDLNNCEVICVDDGSTDKSSEILEEFFNNSQITCPCYVFHKKNGGASSARNYGIQKASGQYLCFVDSDDTLLPDAIVCYKEKILKKHSDIYYVDCVITQYGERIDELRENEYPLIKASDFYRYTWIEEHKVLQGFTFCHIFSRSWFLKNNLHYHEGIVYEDFLLQQEASFCEGSVLLLHVQNPTYCYRIFREGSQTAKGVMKNFKDRQFVARYVDKKMRLQGIEDVWRSHSLLDFYFGGLHEAFISGNIRNRNLFFDKKDCEIMSRGILTQRERNHYLLLRLNFTLACRYRAGVCRPMIRRLINICFSLLNYLLPHWLIRSERFE